MSGSGWRENMGRLRGSSRSSGGSRATTAIAERLRRVARAVMPANSYMALGELYSRYVVIRRIGFRGLQELNTLRTHGDTPHPMKALDLPNLTHPLWVRPGTSDVIEVVHTILRECYGKYEPSRPPRVIIDAGANIGDSTCWFLSRYTEATVIALEPDPENFEVLLRNTNPYGSRVHCIKAGLWFRDHRLKVCDGGSKIAMYVREGDVDNSDCDGLSPQTIASRFKLPYIDIFKIDIEGAEAELFTKNTSWLSNCGVVYIDSHSQDAASAIESAARQYSLSCNRYRELCILSR
jgi:FkbM family methyltransferase